MGGDVAPVPTSSAIPCRNAVEQHTPRLTENRKMRKKNAINRGRTIDVNLRAFPAVLTFLVLGPSCTHTLALAPLPLASPLVHLDLGTT